MLQKLINRLLRRRHFWRNVGFDELSEIYVSMMFRGLAISLTGLFIPLYMLRLGYGVTDVALLATYYFVIRVAMADIAAAYMTARLGPKHTMLVGSGLLITSTMLFLTQPQLYWPLALLGFVWGASASFFFVPFHVDFSKVKHKEHGGKELGYVNIMEKLGYAIGPVLGGAVATIFGAQYIFLMATLLLVVGLVPLFRTAEPVRSHQQLDWKGLDVGRLRHDFASYAALGVENTLCIFLWPLYLGVFVLVGSAAYAKLGVLSSLAVVGSISSAFIIGKVIDNKKGRQLLRISAVLNALVHAIRPFIRSYGLSAVTNVANEGITTGYRMPYLKGLFDAADDLPGYRIVYIASIEWFGSAAKALAWAILTVLSTVTSAHIVMIAGFWIAGCASLLVMTERFKALS